MKNIKLLIVCTFLGLFQDNFSMKVTRFQEDTSTNSTDLSETDFEDFIISDNTNNNNNYTSFDHHTIQKFITLGVEISKTKNATTKKNKQIEQKKTYATLLEGTNNKEELKKHLCGMGDDYSDDERVENLNTSENPELWNEIYRNSKNKTDTTLPLLEQRKETANQEFHTSSQHSTYLQEKIAQLKEELKQAEDEQEKNDQIVETHFNMQKNLANAVQYHQYKKRENKAKVKTIKLDLENKIKKLNHMIDEKTRQTNPQFYTTSEAFKSAQSNVLAEKTKLINKRNALQTTLNDLEQRLPRINTRSSTSTVLYKMIRFGTT